MMNGKSSTPEKKRRGSPLMKLSAYVLALRPWSFSASLMPVMLGCTLAHKATGEFSLVALITTALTALSVHAAGNVVNTYFDYVKGIDSKKSDDRTLVDQLLSKDEIVTLGVILYSIGCAGFVILTMVTTVRLEHLALVYFGGLSSSFLYTGGIGFKYIALGDVMILIFFGPMTVLFSYMVQAGHVQWATILYAIPLALNTEAILHSNNTRDLESDSQAGIVTLAIIIGRTASEVLYAIFLFAPYTMFAVWGMKYSSMLFLPLITIPEAFRLERHFRTVGKETIPKRTAKLNAWLGFLYVLGCAFSDPAKLPYIL
ncbi:ubiA prenyltransferase domain-containing protein 1 homolog [Homarus americanus]|uniref:UbiA prenyltransferase domain-containing protein 1-like n=1 Tax=Homarus americanus TaxID=6706 RepID=A0A8J5JYY9_HOMAM|nr:ubiA prenyltransferase domain-containing protein 1 homolog [Homarus americanus]XP_042226893.1 ubiA prenyltransferase domain-containing protein 1 homolog [Homarus americanus]KAG7166171.1 UbiA prenyltransferase domain-containing protein 1-like [Homarus americanus]